MLIEALGQLIAQQRQRHLVAILRLQTAINHRQPLLLNQRQRRFGLAVRQEKVIQQIATDRQPLRQRPLLGETASPQVKLHQQRCEVTHQLGDQTTGFVIGQHRLPFALPAVHRVAQQHAGKAEPPGVLAGRRQVQLTDVVVIHSPADPGLVDPLAQVAQPLFIDVKARRQHRHVQQRQHIFAGEAAVGQREQSDKRLQHRVRLAGAAIGDRPRQPAVAAGGAKHRLYIGAVAVDIRHHDDDIPRRERRIRLQHRQQPIVQNLHFTLRTVADVNAQAAVILRQRTFVATVGERLCALPGHRRVAQFEDIRLQVMQQVIGNDIDKGVQLLIALQPRQQVDIIAPQFAPGGEQRVADILFPGVIKQPRRLLGVAKQG